MALIKANGLRHVVKLKEIHLYKGSFCEAAEIAPLALDRNLGAAAASSRCDAEWDSPAFADMQRAVSHLDYSPRTPWLHHALSGSHSSNLSRRTKRRNGLDGAVSSGLLNPAGIVGIFGKTEGNGCVNDSRGAMPRNRSA